MESRYENSEFLKQYLPEAKFNQNEMLFRNASKRQTYIRMFGAATGIRGFKSFGKRPQLALFDDLISDTLDEYIAKYGSAKRAAIKKYAKNNPRLNDKESISFYMCTIRQQKADDLIFEILKRHSAEWWD